MKTREFIEELEKKLELVRPLRKEADGVWVLSIHEGTTVTISTYESGYSFQCSFAECPTKNVEDFLTKALFGNLLGQGTSNGTLGLEGDGKKLILSFENPKEGDYKQFQEELEDFCNAVDYWIDEAKK